MIAPGFPRGPFLFSGQAWEQLQLFWVGHAFQGAEPKSGSGQASNKLREEIFSQRCRGTQVRRRLAAVVPLWLPVVWPGAPRLYWVDSYSSERYAQLPYPEPGSGTSCEIGSL